MTEEMVSVTMRGVTAGNALTAYAQMLDGRTWRLAYLIRSISSTMAEAWTAMGAGAVDWHDEPLVRAYHASSSPGGLLTVTFAVVPPPRKWWGGRRSWRVGVAETTIADHGEVETVSRCWEERTT